MGRGIQASQEPELGNGNRVLSGEGMHLDTKMWLLRAEIPKYLSFKTLILFLKNTGELKVFWFM